MTQEENARMFASLCAMVGLDPLYTRGLILDVVPGRRPVLQAMIDYRYTTKFHADSERRWVVEPLGKSPLGKTYLLHTRPLPDRKPDPVLDPRQHLNDVLADPHADAHDICVAMERCGWQWTMRGDSVSFFKPDVCKVTFRSVILSNAARAAALSVLHKEQRPEDPFQVTMYTPRDKNGDMLNLFGCGEAARNDVHDIMFKHEARAIALLKHDALPAGGLTAGPAVSALCDAIDDVLAAAELTAAQQKQPEKQPACDCGGASTTGTHYDWCSTRR